MKVRPTVFRSLGILLLFITSISSCDIRLSDSDANQLYCRIGVADITPEESVYLAGFANRQGTSGPVHRHLLTQCLVLKSNLDQVCIIVNDLMEVSSSSIREIKDDITGSTGFPSEHIFIHQTHTHSAPIMDEMDFAWSEANERYRESVLIIISDNAIRTILDTLAFIPCRIKTGYAVCNIGINRRAIDPATGKTVIGESTEGFFDPEIGILQLTGPDNKPVATLFNYSCHPVTLGFENLAVSPDFVGEARSSIEALWGGTAIFLNGAAGDINPVFGLSNSTALADQEGSKLGNAVTQAMLTEDTIVCLKVNTDRIVLPYRNRDLTPDRIREEVSRKCAEATEFITWKEDVKKWGEKMMRERNEKRLPDNRIMEAGGIRIGSSILVFSQGEVFNEYHARLKRSFPERMILFAGYTNGESGYLPDKQAFKKGGYEVDQAYIYLGEPSPLLPASDSIFSEKMNALIRNLL
jgi:neutral ceramidase